MCGEKMDKPYADLHVHSYYSDGSMSPEEIVEDAVANDVGVLAIADHNVLTGSILARELCRSNKIHYIPAVEIDTLDKGKLWHILAYGFDVDNEAFCEYIKHTRFLMDELSVKLVELMQHDYTDITLEDFFEFTYDRRLGGWRALHYFIEKGVTTTLLEGMPLYSKYNVTYGEAGYSTVAATALRIKQAGGYSVLAHPGEMMDTSDICKFKEELIRLISYGINGIECYYPKNSDAVTQACLDVCNDYDLLITAGSDCHGTFIPTRVGEMNIRADKLRLKDLAVAIY